MRVIHIVKDGSIVEDINGRVVRLEDAGPLYDLFDSINRKGFVKTKRKGKSNEVRVC